MGKKSTTFMAIGSLLLIASLGLTVYNIHDNQRAGFEAGYIAEQLESGLEESASEQKTQKDKVNHILEAPTEEIPDYILNPEMDMPTAQIDGADYIGILDMPTLGLKLPVMSDWDYPSLKIAPCRYSGSAYKGNLVIAAHNYNYHFGTIKNLGIGDRITFTDSDGNVFQYQVAAIETLDPYDVEDMIDGEWNLTLFTCTIGGQSRVTVRCDACD